MNPAEATRLMLLLALLLAGCQEPRYRTQVKGNGQGGVEIQRVPNDAPPARPAATQSQFEALEAQLRQQRAEIEALQSQIEKQSQEIRRLKQAPTTAATAP